MTIESPNLHQMIFEELRRQSPMCANAWNTLSTIHNESDHNAAMHAANQFWRIQLGRLPVSTISQRECLEDNISLTDWWHNFTKYVIGTIVIYQLPTH